MIHVQRTGRQLLAIVATLILAACMDNQAQKWTLWYMPEQTQSGSCATYVFATPTQSRFVVAVFKGWTNPPGAGPKMFTGEDVTGNLDIGKRTLHDDSNGHDMAVDVIYSARAYQPAKLSADANCATPARAR